MDTFTLMSFKDVLDKTENENLEAFTSRMRTFCGEGNEGDVDEIMNYMSGELGVTSAQELRDLSIKDITNLCDFINYLVR